MRDIELDFFKNNLKLADGANRNKEDKFFSPQQ